MQMYSNKSIHCLKLHKLLEYFLYAVFYVAFGNKKSLSQSIAITA